MPLFFSTSVKNSITRTLSFSTSRKSPGIMPALGAIQTCSATRGPQSPRQRPSSQAKSESLGFGIDSGAVGDKAAPDATAEPGWDCEVAPAGCCADCAGEEVKNASAAANANRKRTPILIRNTLGLREMQRWDFPTGFTLPLNGFVTIRVIFWKTLSWRYPKAAHLRPKIVRYRKELAHRIALTALRRCTIMEFCE